MSLKSTLMGFEKEQLINLIAELYKKHKVVKEHLDYALKNNDDKALIKTYQQKIYAAFYPKGGRVFNLTKAKSAITEVKKIGVSPDILADLMLYYVETGISITLEYGDINDAFYGSLISMYRDALKHMKTAGILNKYKDRVKCAVIDTRNMGWGFHDEIKGGYSDYFQQ
jgi:Family of unknown function (DUF6155)